MGRITIFSLGGCVHCNKIKGLFGELGWDYYDIDLEQYPDAKESMIKLTDRLTVPQVFLQETHIGGANDVMKLHSDGKLAALYDKLVAQQPGDPELKGLQILASKSSGRTASRSKSLQEPPICFAGSCITYRELAESLVEPSGKGSSDRTFLDIKPCYSSRFYTHLRCFTGKNLIDVLVKRFHFPGGRTEGVEVCTMLMQSNMFQEVVNPVSSGPGTGGFQDRKDCFYRMQSDITPCVLNSWRVWNDRVGDNPMKTLERCQKQMKKALNKHTNSTSGLVAYNDVRADKLFTEFEFMVCELQKVSLVAMGLDYRKAFCINLYNLMISHAFVKLGVPTTTFQRLSFYDSIGYNVGGDFYSFEDVEHGILRGNSRRPYSFSPPFKKTRENATRLKTVFEEPDPRVHFALNCGGASCPMVKWFTAEAVDEELRLASMGFLESDENFEVAPSGGGVLLNKILDWYENDFGQIKSKGDIVSYLSRFLRGEKLDAVTALIKERAGNIEVKYRPYDWTTNADFSFNRTQKFNYRNFSQSKFSCAIM